MAGAKLEVRRRPQSAPLHLWRRRVSGMQQLPLRPRPSPSQQSPVKINRKKKGKRPITAKVEAPCRKASRRDRSGNIFLETDYSKSCTFAAHLYPMLALENHHLDSLKGPTTLLYQFSHYPHLTFPSVLLF